MAAQDSSADTPSSTPETELDPESQRDLSAAPRSSPPEVLTVEELAALLRLNRKTVYDALARDEIPGARRIGGAYRIHRAAVIDWFASGQARVSRKRSR